MNVNNKPFISEENEKFYIKKKWIGGIVLGKYVYLQKGCWLNNKDCYPKDEFLTYEDAELKLKDIIENGCEELT